MENLPVTPCKLTVVLLEVAVTTSPVAPDVPPVNKAPWEKLHAADIVTSENILISKRCKLYFDVLFVAEEPTVPLAYSIDLAFA